MAEAYPLHWPVGWNRTQPQYRSRSRFGDHSLKRGCEELFWQIESLGAKSVVLSTNVELRLDGIPCSNRRPPQDPGVAVYFTYQGQQTVLACDIWDRVEHNLWAIAKHVEAMRGQARWGVGNLKQAFAGYRALPAPDAMKHWTEVFGMPVDTPAQEVSAKYREIMKTAHPDAGGSTVQAAEINAAYNEFRREREIK